LPGLINRQFDFVYLFYLRGQQYQCTQHMFKVLYLHTGKDDFFKPVYLSWHCSVSGENCVDVPRFDEAYTTLPDKSKYKGGGFTVYGLLPDIPSLAAKRNNWENKIHNYDLIVVSDIVLLWRTAFRITAAFPGKEIALLDGNDSAALFPLNHYLPVYERYLYQSYRCIENNTTIKRAEQILSSCFG
jgi:hypothetical protein